MPRLKYPDPEHIGHKSGSAPIRSASISVIKTTPVDDQTYIRQYGSNAPQEMEEVNKIIATDPLYKMTDRDRELLRRYRV